MLQQTQVDAVKGYFRRFMELFPDVATLARASEDDVLRLWSGLGYYARARNMHKAARAIVEVHAGRFPPTAKAIEELPGVGRSTAAAVAAFAFGERVAILDGNVKRVLARQFGIEGFPGAAKVEAALWDIAGNLLPRKTSAIGSYTQGLMDLGATVCTRNNPSCGACPIAADCVARNTGRTADLPTPRPKKKYPTREASWLVLLHRGDVLLERRPSPGIWGGLWVFPEAAKSSPALHCLTEYGCVVTRPRRLPKFFHGFTHFRLEVSPVVFEVGRREPRAESHGRKWIPVPEALAEAVPVPVRRVLQSL
jgi:A/G-specific adenine glycosylase